MSSGPQRRLDPFGAFAYAMYVLVGGFLVFGYAWSLRGAVDNQREAACRALSPEQGREADAPSFEVQDLEGNRVTLDDFAGKFVVLNFWATWCEPCITEWPQVHRLAERLVDRDDIVVLAISIEEDRSAIEPFLRRMSLEDTPVRVLWDPQQDLHERFGTEKIPDTYFVGPDGRVVHTFVNTRKWGTPDAYHCVSKTADRRLR
jgi:thiol-disulfide isomerase/thioredoxin